MFFNTLYDEDVIEEEVFYKWESCKDPAEQTGKGVALKSVTGFFTFLRNAEEESDKDWGNENPAFIKTGKEGAGGLQATANSSRRYI